MFVRCSYYNVQYLNICVASQFLFSDVEVEELSVLNRLVWCPITSIETSEGPGMDCEHERDLPVFSQHIQSLFASPGLESIWPKVHAVRN